MQRADQSRAIGAVAKAAGFGELTQRFIGLVGGNRRLFALPAIIKSFRKMLADKRGEVAAEVTAAHALTDAQKAAVSDAIKRVVGGKVSIDMKVDPSLLGGLDGPRRQPHDRWIRENEAAEAAARDERGLDNGNPRRRNLLPS